MKVLVTGATGFVGSHVAEALVQRGAAVRTVARPTSDGAFLKQLGVEILAGDLADEATLRKACAGVDAVVHCAAKVGDWGPIDEYRAVNVTATENLLRAAGALGDKLKRFVLVSSLGVYEARDHFGSDETAPLPTQHIDGYTQTKAEADRMALQLAPQLGIPLVIVRPGFVYGPRDRTVMPRILFNLKIRLVSYFGSRHKLMNNVYVGNVVQGVLLALDRPQAVGGVYNLTDGQCVSKKVFFETICELARLPKPLLTYPRWFARGLCSAFEALGKLFHFQPLLTMARYKFMGLNLDYSIERARRELGYEPAVDFATGMRRTIDWLRQEGRIR